MFAPYSRRSPKSVSPSDCSSLRIFLHRFNFDAVASELRGRLRDAARSTERRGDLDWAPPPKLLTAEQVRLRWALIDRQLCLHDTPELAARELCGS